MAKQVDDIQEFEETSEAKAETNYNRKKSAWTAFAGAVIVFFMYFIGAGLSLDPSLLLFGVFISSLAVPALLLIIAYLLCIWIDALPEND